MVASVVASQIKSIPSNDSAPSAPAPSGAPPPLAAGDEANRRSAQRRRGAHKEPAVAAPTRKGVPVLGNILEVRKRGLIGFLENAWREHGDVFRVNMGVRGVVVAHPDGIERVLAGNVDNYVKGKTYDGVRRVLGDGLLTLEGQVWRTRRRMIQPSFHRSALAGMAQTMVEVGALHFDDMKRRFPEGGTVDAGQEMVKLTLDVVVAALFGRDLSDAASVNHDSLGAALELVSELANGIPVPEWVPTPANLKLKRTLVELESAVYRVIAAGRARKVVDDGSLLGMLLSTRDADTGELLSDKAVRDEVFTLFIAGHETTALTLTWLFVLLEQEDACVDRMREEATRVVGDREPTFEDVPNLTYIRQVIDEVLRLRGPVALNARTAVASDNVLGFRIEAGDTVMPLFWAAHRHPDFWDEPARFDPERFTAENKATRDPWCYLPFSAGKRVCIGNTFSLVETTLLLAQMLRRFDFKMKPGQNIAPNVIATVRPSDRVLLDVKWR